MQNVIFQTTSGNVIGVVEAPAIFHPRRPVKNQYIVKIGVIDRDGGLAPKDARTVVQKLRDVVRSL